MSIKYPLEPYSKPLVNEARSQSEAAASMRNEQTAGESQNRLNEMDKEISGQY